MIEIRRISIEDPKYGELLELRNAVLRVPLGLSIYNDDLSSDARAIILTAQEEGRIIGCVLLMPHGADIYRLRAMAVADGYQKTGVGRMLVEAAEATAAKDGIQEIVLHARVTAIGFYEKLGYSIAGQEFTEVGIPHKLMQKRLA